MKKAQIHMMETTLVLLFFFILLGLGFIFWVMHYQSSLREKEMEYEHLEVVKRTMMLKFLPELQCSEQGDVYYNCYDIIKIVYFNNLVEQNNLYYANLLGNTRIMIRHLDLANNRTDRTWILYDSKPLDKGYRTVLSPVYLYNATSNIYNFGVLEARIYR